jgi:hypothetical protein
VALHDDIIVWLSLSAAAAAANDDDDYELLGVDNNNALFHTPLEEKYGRHARHRTDKGTELL